MLFSGYYVPTLKEDPAEAEVISHKLLLRAGMIRKLTSGMYTYLPLGLRAVNKVAKIVREEMDRAGALEVLMPMVQPADLWQETGRWEFYGKELLRFKDRHGRDYCLGPTHEEVVTDLIRGEVRSYKQLPLNLYQIQTKFRDEIRPRFGLMRGREFVMKDGYSFDANEDGANQSYARMYEAYVAIFSRIGLEFRPVEADTGSIGGSYSHEFMVLADTGEDTIAVCTQCDYAANLEKAEVTCVAGDACSACSQDMVEVATPGKHAVDEVAAFLGVDPQRILKTLLYDIDGESVAVLVRGDREVNECKLKTLLGGDVCQMASAKQVEEWTQAPVGFAGPVGLKVDKIYADFEVRTATDWIAGANKKDTHVMHVDIARDVKLTGYADLRQITDQDVCPRCGAPITLPKGIEVGHVFKLGTKYSESMNACYLDENGKEKPMIMGCYGIGVSRVVAAAIEQNHDEHGMMFPPSIAPFEVSLLALTGAKDDDLRAKAVELHDVLENMGVEVLLDDRKERPGIKFKDADLMGAPMQLVLGKKGLTNGIIEAKNRKTGEKMELPLEGFQQGFEAWRKEVYASWGLEVA
ncbi:proline--tRNA ligase [Desulfoplanes formicivorans]|uniref:Proline--tRNA ligase n=1 Tax=Desulfoplanes formicivorans TaxID=1592317 RepID=A0A194AG74_9BACT|nr:proline--tRNA ligase [Desulfoplanes formicivorans]GAU08086.1 prolyl-tRNA synthetase [Desulfoplanes formicivorans]